MEPNKERALENKENTVEENNRMKSAKERGYCRSQQWITVGKLEE